jgi:hypothetical protein
MKLGKLIVAALLLVGTSTSYAQDGEATECKRMLFLAQQARMERQDYKESTLYMILAEKECGSLDAKNMKILIASLRNTINGTQDAEEKKAYSDTLDVYYNKSEDAGFYDQADDLIRAAIMLGTTTPNRVKADELFQRGIAAQGEKTNEGYISYYYYNLYAMYAAAPVDDRPDLKRRMISVYFELSALISKASMSAQTQETIKGYFNAVVNTCEDVLPELKGFMETLPEDVEMRKSALMDFITLLEEKQCTDADEYGDLINAFVETDPTSLDAQLMKAKYLISKKKYREAIVTLKTAKGLSTDEAQKQEITYRIADAQYRMGSLTTAYKTAMSVSGEFRGKALVIAGNSVSKNANNCGSSTFERKCNYIYAVQLLEQARAKGASVSGISGMRANFPTDEEIFDNDSPSSVTLTCYGISVNPKG